MNSKLIPLLSAAALLATRDTSATLVAHPDLATEALVRMELDDFPVWVAIDAEGNDLYAEARAGAVTHEEDGR